MKKEELKKGMHLLVYINGKEEPPIYVISQANAFTHEGHTFYALCSFINDDYKIRPYPIELIEEAPNYMQKLGGYIKENMNAGHILYIPKSGSSKMENLEVENIVSVPIIKGFTEWFFDSYGYSVFNGVSSSHVDMIQAGISYVEYVTQHTKTETT